MKKIFLGFVISSLHATLAAAFSLHNVTECPSPERITVLTTLSSPYLWVAPKFPQTVQYGVGYGGETVGSFIASIPFGQNEYLCLYGSSTHPSLASIPDTKLQQKNIFKKIPDNFNYGFLLYENK